jgi:hypothetical protein
MLDACNGNIDIVSYVQEARGRRQEAVGVEQSPPPAS